MENTTIQDAYLHNDYQIHSMLWPLMNLINEFFDQYSPPVNDNIFRSLDNYTLVNIYHEVIKRGSTNMIFLYILLTLAVLTLLVIPFVICSKLYSKNKINIYKYQWCFGLEGLILFVSFCCLFIGCISTTEFVMQTSRNVQKYPESTKVLVNRVHLELLDAPRTFRQINDKRRKISHLVLCSIENIGERSQRKINQSIYNQLITEEKYYSDAMTKLSNNLQNGGFFLRSKKISHSIELMMSDVKHVLNEMNRNIDKIKIEFNGNLNFKLNENRKNDLLNDIKLIKEAVAIPNTSYEYPDWDIVYKDVNKTTYETIPKMKKSLFFLEPLRHLISYRTDDAAFVLESRLSRIDAISEHFYCKLNRVVNIFIKSLCKIKKFFNETGRFLNINTKCKLLSSYIYIYMLPICYGICLLVLIGTASLLAIKDLNAVFKHKKPYFNYNKDNFVLKTLNFSIIMGVSFLWILLLLTALHYFLSVAITMVCAPLNSGAVFTDYLDDPWLWNSSSWLTHSIQTEFPNYKKQVKVEDVMQNCHKDKSIYKILSIWEYWNKYRGLDIDDCDVEFDELSEVLQKETNNIPILPDYLMNTTLQQLHFAHKYLNDSFVVNKIMKDLDELDNRNITSKVINMMQNLPRDILYDDIQNTLKTILRDSEFMYDHIISYIYLNIKKLEKFKIEIIEIEKDLQGRMKYQTVLRKKWIDISQKQIKKETKNAHEKMLYHMHIFSNFKQSFITFNHSCKIYPESYRTFQWAVCEYSLDVMQIGWLNIFFIAFAASLCILGCCRFVSYMYGFYEREMMKEQIGLDFIKTPRFRYLPLDPGENLFKIENTK